MKHLIYKTTSKSGKFYIGRHSTVNINDGYCGSGKWVKSIRDKSELTVEILEYANSIKDLILLEGQYLNRYIGQPGNMNYNNRPTGFASGNHNPTKKGSVRSESVKRKIKQTVDTIYSKMTEQERKEKFGHPGEKNGFYNKTHSVDFIEKQRQIAVNRGSIGNPNAKPVTINGVTYPLMKIAMKDLGLTRTKLLKLLGEA